MASCDNCGVICSNDGMSPQYIQFKGQQKRFCSAVCVNQFKDENGKAEKCAWCNCQRSNFDMIKHEDADNKDQLFCSRNCLSFYRVNLQATSSQTAQCDQCKKHVPAQYYLTMSDATVRNFCSYQCVATFQSRYTGKQSQPPLLPPPPSQNIRPTHPSNQTLSSRQSTRATSSQTAQCDQCKKHLSAMFRSTMSDATVRYFCSYQCVATFWSLFTGKHSQPPLPPLPSQNNKPTPPSTQTMNTRQSTRGTFRPIKPKPTGALKSINIPIMSNVVPIAPKASSQIVQCDQCKNHIPVLYHSTMSFATVWNFCSYQCVATFWSLYTGKQSQPTPPLSQNYKLTPPSNHTMSTRQSTRGTLRPIKPKPTGALKSENIPIISDVVPVAPKGNQHVNVKTNPSVSVMVNNPQTQQASSQGTITQHIIIKPAAPKSMINKSLLCKPLVKTKATSCRPHTQTKETQTDEDFDPCVSVCTMYTQPTSVSFPIQAKIVRKDNDKNIAAAKIVRIKDDKHMSPANTVRIKNDKHLSPEKILE